VFFASILLIIIYLRPKVLQNEGFEDSSMPSPEPAENVLKVAEEAAAVIKSEEHFEDGFDENRVLKQPGQQVEEPLLPKAMEFTGIYFLVKIIFLVNNSVFLQVPQLRDKRQWLVPCSMLGRATNSLPGDMII